MVLLFQAWASLCGFEPYSGFDAGGTGLAQSAFSAHDTRERQDTHWRGSITITVEVVRRMGCVPCMRCDTKNLASPVVA